MRRFLTCWLALAMLLVGHLARSASAEEPYEPTWESLRQRDPAPEWFRDAKFGIYFHWGVYSVPAFASEWYPRWMHKEGRPEHAHHVETYGQPTEFGYHDFVPMFGGEKFDAEEWAELFEKSGARFAGPVAEHHDGFAMWDSDVTPWNAADMGPNRDILGQLAEALRERDIRVVATFHHARNNTWQKNGQWTGHFEFVKKNYPELLEDPKNAILYGYMPREEFLEFWKAKLVEVIEQYEPDLIWFDSWLDEIPEEYQKEFLAFYFNHAKRHGKEVVVTFKQEDLPLDVATLDLEKGRMNQLTDYAWLTDDTISRGSWCYTRDLDVKLTPQVLHVLIDIVSKNGQLLLNISPKADGTIPDNQRDVILGIGQWLDQFGEAIYATRPWVTFGEGPTRLKKGGGFTHQHSGYLTYTPKDIRYTRSKDGRAIYAIVLGWPGADKEIVLETFAPQALEGDLRVEEVSLLGSDTDISWKQRDDGLAIRTPDQAPDDMAIAFKIAVSGSAKLASQE